MVKMSSTSQKEKLWQFSQKEATCIQQMIFVSFLQERVTSAHLILGPFL